MKLQPKIFPGKLNAKDNKSAIDWHWQNLLAYGSNSHIVIVDPNHLNVIQTLCEHKYNVSIVKWSNDVLSNNILSTLDSSNSNSNSSGSVNNIIRLASADINGIILIWNVLEGQVMNYLTNSDMNATGVKRNDQYQYIQNQQNLQIMDMCWHTEDSNLLLVLYGNSIQCLNVSNSTRLWRKDIPEFTPAKSLQFDPFKSNQLYICTQFGCVYQMDDIPTIAQTPQQLPHLEFKFRVLPSKGGNLNTLLNTDHSQTLAQWLQVQSLQQQIQSQQGSVMGGGGLSQSSGIQLQSGQGTQPNTSLSTSSEFIQMIISPNSKNLIYLVMLRDLYVFDSTTNQLFGSLQLDRNKPSFQHVIIGKDNPNLMFSLHEDSSITSWIRKIESFNTHNYDQLSSSDLIHYQKKSKKKGQPIISIINHPFFDQTLLSITSDGIIWKWDFISELTSDSCSLFSPRLTQPSIIALNGVIKLATSGLLETASSPVTSVSVYPFFNKGMVCLVAIGTSNGTIQIINMSNLKVQKEIFVWNRAVLGIKWLSPGRVLCHSFEEQEKNSFLNFIASVDFRSGRIREFRKVSGTEPSYIRGIRLSYSRRFLVLLMKDRPFELWETKKFTCLRSFKPFTHIVGLEWLPPLVDSEVELSPDSTKYEQKEQFTFLLQDGSIKQCTIEANSVTLQEVNADLGNQVHICLAYKREFLVSGDQNGNINSWNLVKKKLHSISTHRGPIKKIRFSPSASSSEILVMFQSGEFGIWDLNLNQRLTLSTYLMEREIKAADLEWAQDQHPIIVTNDQSIRILDQSLSVTNSRYQFQPYPQTPDGTNYLYSPLLLPVDQCTQLKNLLLNYRLFNNSSLTSSQLNKSQEGSLKEQNNKLLALIDENILNDLEQRPTAESSLVVAQFFGDQKEIEFWRVAINSLSKYQKQKKLDYSLSDQIFYNSELVNIYYNLPGVPIRNYEQVPTTSTTTSQQPTPVINPISGNNSTNTSTQNTPYTSGNTSSTGGGFSFNPLTINSPPVNSSSSNILTSPILNNPPPQPTATTTSSSSASNLLKKPLSSLFGFGLQKSQLQNTSTSQLSPPTTPVKNNPNNNNNSNTNNIPQQGSTLSSSISFFPSLSSSQQQSNPSTQSLSSSTMNTNPLSVSQVFSSVASQLQSLESSTDGIGSGYSPSGSNSPSLYASLNDSTILRGTSGGLANTNTHESLLPGYYDILLDSNVFRNQELEKTDYHEKKKPDQELSKKLIERNILLGRTPRAVNLLLDTTPDNPDFYNRALKASVISASISMDYYQSTTKLIAENLIAVGKVDEGVQFLCMIGKSFDACKYLQSADRWYDASKLAKIKLSEEEQLVVYRAWVVNLLYKSKSSIGTQSQSQHLCSTVASKSFQFAISLLLSLGDFRNVVNLLYENQQYDIASLLLMAGLENSVFNDTFDHVFEQSDLISSYESNQGTSSDFTFQQLTQIIFKEYGNMLHQLGNTQSAEFYWKMSGKKEQPSQQQQS
ncbi:hypothetical protein DLAC_10310 [Tieghemostelium lacteum]|uniref:WD40 repeat-containing protein n=1 Tax=Tieghemostelium lacteum TaxID=361077 RepID=A0A151Z544_TIELA|nr:hypothetical protein DLAC_10310 [Tieghemostelium lacteum]|eukprot:KYQ89082.1 hypothetical protein DLAC_10310 [Tieghemostelium lacteum]